MKDAVQLFGIALPGSAWAFIGVIGAALIAAITAVVAQLIGRSNVKLQIERDDRARLQRARLEAYQEFFAKADLWSSIMAEDTRRNSMAYEDIKKLQNETIYASHRARLVAPAETVRLMIGYLSFASQAVLYSASDPTSQAAQKARIDAEQAHGRLTDAARADVGNSGSIALMYQRVS